jgi:hypothetical protein
MYPARARSVAVPAVTARHCCFHPQPPLETTPDLLDGMLKLQINL